MLSIIGTIGDGIRGGARHLKRNDVKMRKRRWEDFRRRAEYSPDAVYRHRIHGWEYIPVHPFGDEPALLERLDLRPEDCRCADIWWGIEGDATLLQSYAERGLPGTVQYFAKPTSHRDRWLYLEAVFDAPFVSRALVEAAMTCFAEAGFPSGPIFQSMRGANLPPHRPVRLSIED